MPGDDAVLRPASPSALTLELAYDDAPLRAAPGDTVSAALLRAGRVATGRSLKFRRPRGPFCLQGDCGTCLLRVDGEPNLRACTTIVRPGMQLHSQNRVLPRGPDPTALVDTVFAAGMDHHHFMVRPRLVNTIMQEVARNLAGLGTLPDAPAEPPAAPRHEAPQVLVVGAGRAGLAALRRLRRAGVAAVCVERLDRDGARARCGDDDGEVRYGTAVFGLYPREHGRGVIAARVDDGEGRGLVTFAPRHLVLATGTRDVIVPLRNNDLPGVLAARGLASLLRRTGDALAVPGVVVGEGDRAAALAQRLGLELLAPASVEAVLGGARVEAIATREGRRELGVVALAGAPAPASELARQCGATVRWSDVGFAVARDDDGRAATGTWTTWACGEVCGVSERAAADDGERVAQALLDTIGRAP